MDRSGLFFAHFLPNILIFGGEIVKNLAIAEAHSRFDAFCRPVSWTNDSELGPFRIGGQRGLRF